MALVTLSFDNGPDPRVTPYVLDILGRCGIVSTFFVLGRKLAEPGGLDLARHIAERGHRLGNHSYSHEIPLGRDPRPDAVYEEIERTAQLLDSVWDGPRWFRPFGGGGVIGTHLLSAASVDHLVEHRYTCALWNCVPGDWLDARAWTSRALARIDDLEHAVVVLHDTLPEATQQLEPFIEALQRRGHTIVQDFPAECLPIVDGELREPIAPIVTIDPTARRS